MTKRRPSNKKPTGLNKTLGNSLSNEREKSRKSHQRAKYDGNDIENPAFMEMESKHYIDSITDETSLEEFLAKAQLAGTEFTAEREHFRVIEKETAIVVPSRIDLKNNRELQNEYEHLLRIPRRPSKNEWSNAEELTRLENENFLKWRNELSELQEVDGLALTPFEKNPDMWRELWRVVEKSDLIVQIVDARNPLLFYSKDLALYVKEVDPAKQIMLLVNKADLLEAEQMRAWKAFFITQGIDALFWSALESSNSEEDLCDDNKPGPSKELDIINDPSVLIDYFKQKCGIVGSMAERQLVVGMVGYPNVGKSSTINKLVGEKKVSVSATPGKTRHFQTIHIDRELCLCDCPGLVMPSFAFGRDEMFLNGILPVDQMRDHFKPVALLLSRIPLNFLEHKYSIMLPEGEPPSALNLLTALAFMRGFMSASGVPDCSRAARMLIKDVVNGKVRWIAAPPGVEQEVFDQMIYPFVGPSTTGRVQLEQLEKRGLLDARTTMGKGVDANFFDVRNSSAHVKTGRGNALFTPTGTVVPSGVEPTSSKKHFNKNKKEKIRRVFVQSY